MTFFLYFQTDPVLPLCSYVAFYISLKIIKFYVRFFSSSSFSYFLFQENCDLIVFSIVSLQILLFFTKSTIISIHVLLILCPNFCSCPNFTIENSNYFIYNVASCVFQQKGVTMGQREGLSRKDIQKIKRMYKCGKK